MDSRVNLRCRSSAPIQVTLCPIDSHNGLVAIVTKCKRECPGRPREITKMWHILEKFIFLIFCSEIPHDELIKVVYLFCSNLLLFSQKIGKIVHDANRYKMVEIKGPSIKT